MSIRVLRISGSPHRHGNTETLLDAFLEGAGNAGGATEKVVVKDLSFTLCQGCNACHRKDGCIVQDELTPSLTGSHPRTAWRWPPPFTRWGSLPSKKASSTGASTSELPGSHFPGKSPTLPDRIRGSPSSGSSSAAIPCRISTPGSRARGRRQRERTRRRSVQRRRGHSRPAPSSRPVPPREAC